MPLPCMNEHKAFVLQTLCTYHFKIFSQSACDWCWIHSTLSLWKKVCANRGWKANRKKLLVIVKHFWFCHVFVSIELATSNRRFVYAQTPKNDTSIIGDLFWLFFSLLALPSLPFYHSLSLSPSQNSTYKIFMQLKMKWFVSRNR